MVKENSSVAKISVRDLKLAECSNCVYLKIICHPKKFHLGSRLGKVRSVRMLKKITCHTNYLLIGSRLGKVRSVRMLKGEICFIIPLTC